MLPQLKGTFMAVRRKAKSKRAVSKLALAKGRSGAELGIQARNLKVKSAESILALAQTVGIAYAAFYEPWAKVGAPKIMVPEQKQAAKDWKDFIRESGYIWPRHYKLLRTLWLIYRKMDLLKPNSENLPNSIDAIHKVVSVRLDPKQQKALFKGLTESHTAKDVAALITHVKTGKSGDLEELDAAGADALLSADNPSSPIQKQSVLSMGADLIAHETFISAANRHSEPNHQGFVVVLCHVDPFNRKVSEIDVLSDEALVEEAIRLAHQKRSDVKAVEAA
jgi:hypothetical protein